MVDTVNGQRHVLLGLASGTPTWTTTIVARLADSQPRSEFILCSDISDLFNRLGTGRTFSALFVDHRTVGLDRELISRATSADCPVVVVGDSDAPARWRLLGASTVVAYDLPVSSFTDVLRHHASPIPTTDHLDLGVGPPEPTAHGWAGRIVAVTGAGDTGTSELARCIASGLGDDPRLRGSVLLVDACLEADQAFLHGLTDDHVGPDLQQVTHAHRGGDLDRTALERLTVRPAGRSYGLLPGLRRRRDWPSIGGPSLRATLVNIRRHHLITVVDVDPLIDLTPPGQTLGPSTPGEPCRIVMSLADIVVVVGITGKHGTRSMERVLSNLDNAGIPPARLLPILTAEPSGSRRRARREARQLARTTPSGVDGPLVLTGPPGGGDDMAGLLAREVLAALDLLAGRVDDGGVVPVAAGSLGTENP